MPDLNGNILFSPENNLLTWADVKIQKPPPKKNNPQ